MTEKLWRDLHTAMSPSEIQALINRWTKATLDVDEEIRARGDAEEIERHNEQMRKDHGGALYMKALNNPQEAKPFVEQLVSALGLDLSEREFDIATRLMIQAQLDVFRAHVSRHSRGWRPWLDPDPAAPLVARVTSDEPALPRTAPIREPPVARYGRLSEVAREAIRDLQRVEQWGPKRIRDYETAVATLVLALGCDPDMGEITPDVAGVWMRDLTRYPTNVTKRKPYRDLRTFRERVDAVVEANDPDVLNHVTINGKYLTPLRRIYEWRQAVKRDLLNPFKDLRAKKPKRLDPAAGRRDFTNSEIVSWLNLPMFTGAQAARGPKLYMPGPVKIDDWRVWVPLIAIFTGMRLNEACGLAVADVRHGDGVDFFHVRDEVEGQRLKSVAARRKVPIHSQLKAVGFMQFVERQRVLGRTRLFEELREDTNGYFSTAPSQFFGRVIDRIQEPMPDAPGELVFHSIRHTVATRLRMADVRGDVSQEIVGHEKNDVHSGYGEYPLPMLREAIEKIVYPGLDLAQICRA